MAQGLKRTVAGLMCVLWCSVLAPLAGNAEGEPALITDYNALMSAVSEAKDGDVLLCGDIDFSPASPDVPNSMMCITVDKSITIRNGKAEGPAVFLNGGFLLAGSKLSGSTLSVTFEGILFDGGADPDALTRADYDYPWSEAEQTYTYYAPLKAQQAVALKGSVAASFTGCTFRHYMHEYGPVIDLRYADYTDNEYLSQIFPDYSTCRVDLAFDGCTVEGNTALHDGGAIYIEGNGNVFMHARNSRFVDNRSVVGEFSRGGGAVFALGAELNFEGCTFEDNTANHAFSDSTLPEYDTHKGGALLLEQGSLTMVCSTVRGNTASVGGGISLTNVKAELDGCRLQGNRAEAKAINPDGMVGPWSNMSQAGALYVEGNRNLVAALVNCDIRDNTAANVYGGIYGYYVPFEDPSLGTYAIKLTLCTYEGNRSEAGFDYASVGDLLWMSHPGDTFTNPHLTSRGCYIVDGTFATDFPREEMPSDENGYNYFAPTANEVARKSTIPAAVASEWLGGRYGDRLSEVTVGSNYASHLYEEETDTSEPETTVELETTGEPGTTAEPESTGDPGVSEAPPPAVAGEEASPLPWILGMGLPLLICLGLGIFIWHRRRAAMRALPPPAANENHAGPAVRTVMTRYEDVEIDRIITLMPETGHLTGRELEVLREILRGRKQSEVAYYLGIEVSTVKDFYKKIYAKLGVENKDALLVKVSEALKKS